MSRISKSTANGYGVSSQDEETKPTEMDTLKWQLYAMRIISQTSG